MREVCSLIWLALVGAFWWRVFLEAETRFGHQVNVLRRKSPKRPTFGDAGPSGNRWLVSLGSEGAGRLGGREAGDRH